MTTYCTLYHGTGVTAMVAQVAANFRFISDDRHMKLQAAKRYIETFPLMSVIADEDDDDVDDNDGGPKSTGRPLEK